MKNLLTRTPQKTSLATRDEYETAWRVFWKMGEELQKRWKTKKTSLEILREERTR